MMSRSANEIREIILESIRQNKISHADYDRIMEIAYADGYLDDQERHAIAFLRDLVDDRTVCIVEDRTSPSRCD